MHTRGLKDDSLVTFSRHRDPAAREQFDNLTSPPGLLQSLSFEMKHTNKILFFFKLSFIFFCLSVPYLYFLLVLSLTVPVILSNLNPLDIYSILLIIYTRTLLIVLALSFQKAYIFIQVIESRIYLKSRNINFRYTKRYYALILAIIFLVSLPYFLVEIFINSSFISDEFINITTSWYLILLLAMLFFLGFIALPYLINKSFGIHMHTHFTDKGIKIHGQSRGQNYQMNFLTNDISSFVLITVPYSELLAYYKTRPAFLVPKKTLPEDISILYLRDQQGTIHLCSYFIQGKQLIQNVQALLIKHYPEVKIEIVKDKEIKDLHGFPYKSLSFFMNNKTFDALKTIFYYPRFIRPLQKDTNPLSNAPLPSASEESIKVENNENTSLKNPSISRFLSDDKLSADNQLLFSMTISMLITFVAWIFCMSFILFWMQFRGLSEDVTNLFSPSFHLPLVAILGVGTIISMPKKWYHPGLASVCYLVVILITLLHLLLYY